MLLIDKILGVGEALNTQRLRRLVDRDKLSAYLPYHAWDNDTKAYHSADETFGYVWECTPLVYAGTDVFETLKGQKVANFKRKEVGWFRHKTLIKQLIDGL